MKTAQFCLLLILSCGTFADGPTLESQFKEPPHAARPWVYWFWINGNITREGITADLEAMKRVGIGGALIMEVDQGVPKGPIAFAGPEWLDLFHHVQAESRRLGIEINMNNDAGWCGSGGPWITPELAMQRVVWSETRVKGPGTVAVDLPLPPANSNYFRDIAVLAFPTPPLEMAPLPTPKVTSSETASIDPHILSDNNRESSLSFPKPATDHPVWIQMEFPEPFTARTVTAVFHEQNNRIHTKIETSVDGKVFQEAGACDLGSQNKFGNFPATTAPIWRLTFTSADTYIDKLSLTELELSPKYRIDNMEGKSALLAQAVGWDAQAPNVPTEATISPESIVNISTRMDAAGKLTWDVPDGDWTVMRFGHTTTGAVNQPAPASGTGLECDKLSKEAIEFHFNALIAKLIEKTGASSAAGLTMTHIDSWETGSQNWSPKFAEDFLQRRGYDIVPWLPVFSGRVVLNKDASERMLWDLRRTVAELVNDNYAGHLRELCHRNGITLSIEAYGNCVLDNLSFAGQADLPMSEFWISGSAMNLAKTMASASHTYGYPITGAEAFTASDQQGKWMQHPASIKALGDEAFCNGINRFVFHRYAMQPWLGRVPGMTMGPWGIHYERTETWWDWTGPWHDYLARCQSLLQQGLFVADVCYISGEGAPNDAPAREHLNPPLPQGYDYDPCSAEIVQRMDVRDGRVVLPSGMSYSVLVLPPTDRMTPGLLRKIKLLADAGATIVGQRPKFSPSLSEYTRCDAEVHEIAAELWDKKAAVKSSVEEALDAAGLQPDFTSKPTLRYIHRRAEDTDIYFIANSQSNSIDALCTFRVAGKVPEIWRPDSGTIERAAVYEQKDGRTFVPLRFEQSGSLFVVFRHVPANDDALVAVVRDDKAVVPPAEPAKPIIKSAVYGPADDPQHAVDVCDAVQQIVDLGERSLQVSRIAKTNDPAPGKVKTLTVEYAVGDTVNLVKGLDADTIHLPNRTVGITVDKAVYGVPGEPSTTRDVRDRIQRLVDAGVYSFPVAKMAEGDDPAFGVVKTLNVDYVIGGKTATITGTDPVVINLAPPPAADADEVAVACIVDGKPALEVFQNGHYQVKSASGAVYEQDVADLPSPQEIQGPWQVSFPLADKPEQVTFERLASWSEHQDPRLKYFSGTATYQKDLQVPQNLIGSDRRVYLDLGKVAIMARVKLNDKDLGILWRPPFRVDITDVARPGGNALQVEVVNLWPNRLIGDEQLPEDSERYNEGNLKQWPQWLLDGKASPTGRQTFTTWRLFTKDSPLLESGLIGPVRLISTVVIKRQ